MMWVPDPELEDGITVRVTENARDHFEKWPKSTETPDETLRGYFND